MPGVLGAYKRVAAGSVSPAEHRSGKQHTVGWVGGRIQEHTGVGEVVPSGQLCSTLGCLVALSVTL